MRYSLAVFDIAGTTVKDNGQINDTFRKTFKDAGVDVAPADIDKVMGYRKNDAVKIIARQYNNEMAANEQWTDGIHKDFIAQMVNFYKNDESLSPLPGAEAIFNILRLNNIKIALNTGFTREITDTILHKIGWKEGEIIDAVICSDEVEEGRPYPLMIQELMRRFNIADSNEVVKVGDTVVDIQEGRNAGCGKVVSVTTGTNTREQLAQYSPDHIIDSLTELPVILSI